jgi:hypothetical protein
VIQVLGCHAKADAFVVTFDIETVEAYLLVEYHGRGHGCSATSSVLATNLASPEEGDSPRPQRPR